MRKLRSTRDPVNPADYVGIVGQSFVKHEHSPVLVIGTHRWDRWTLGRLGCPHPKAAAALNRVVKHLGIDTLAGLAKHARAIGNFKGMGVTAYWTVLAILRSAGYDVVHVHDDSVSYATVKRRSVAQSRRNQRRRYAGHRVHAHAADGQ